MSRGGYELIEEKMMQDKIKQRQESAGESILTPPSPPKRHEKWIMGRKKPSGEYTSEETRLVADKIVSMLFFLFLCVGVLFRAYNLIMTSMLFFLFLRVAFLYDAVSDCLNFYLIAVSDCCL
jgi:hypothetical protein